MKTLLNIPIILAILFSFNTFAQQVPFLNEDVVNTSHFYFPNNGQIADNEGGLHPEVLFHTEFTSPKYFFQENKISFVSLIVDTLNPDTVFRIDMEFYQPPASISESVPNLVAQDQRTVKMNYYLPHCGNGVELVPSYERLIYENAYDDIDVEITSNATGIKARFIIYPGGNPNDILLKFTGQDSVLPQLSGDLKLYLDQWSMDLRQAYAYQIDANNQPYLLSWLPIWNYNGNGIVSVETNSYDPTQPLIIELAGSGSLITASSSGMPPFWSTYYGGTGKEENTDFVTGLSGELFTVSNVKGSGNTFPEENGTTYPNTNTYNVLLTKFSQNEEQMYATYFGGSGDDRGQTLAFDWAHASYYDLYVSGYTTSNDLPTGTASSNFNQNYQSGTDGFIAKFDAALGTIIWRTYFGGNGDDYITDMKMDIATHEMYLCGYTSSTNSGNCTGANGFPICNTLSSSFYQTSNQSANPNGKDAFVAQINTGNIDLVWSTYFGGEDYDAAYAIEFKPTTNGNEVYIVGKTTTSLTASSINSPTSANTNGEFPLANPDSPTYFQSQLGSSSSTVGSDGFIAHFNALRELIWSTFYGGNSSEGFDDIAVNVNGVFAVGYTYSNTSGTGTCTTNSNGSIPKCTNQPNGYTETNQGLSDILITQFTTAGELTWSTCYGAPGKDAIYSGVSCVTDNLDNIYIISNSFPEDISSPVSIVTVPFNGQYYQDENSHIVEGGDGSDNILLMFNKNNERIWVTYFGGGCNGCNITNGDEFAQTITSFGSEWLYFGGLTYSKSTPTWKSWSGAYYEGVHSSGTSNFGYPADGYITKLYIADIATFLEELTEYGKVEYVKGYPNPTTDFVTIEVPQKETQLAKIALYTSAGKQINTFSTFTDGEKIRLDVTAIKSGLYFMKIFIENESYVYSFVKQ